jgi:hypothetical protein
MAGDWIKLQVNIWTNPKLVTLASRLSVTNVTAVGAVCHAWCVADQHGDDDGCIEIGKDAFDTMCGVDGLCDAMHEVGWIEIHENHLKFPNYCDHNGTTAKKRASAQKRKSRSRKSVTDVTPKRDASVTREEKRREEIPAGARAREDATHEASAETHPEEPAAAGYFAYKEFSEIAKSRNWSSEAEMRQAAASANVVTAVFAAMLLDCHWSGADNPAGAAIRRCQRGETPSPRAEGYVQTVLDGKPEPSRIIKAPQLTGKCESCGEVLFGPVASGPSPMKSMNDLCKCGELVLLTLPENRKEAQG